MALGNAGIFHSSLLIILPPLMLLNVRKKTYRTWQAPPILSLLVTIGIHIMQILSSSNIRPMLFNFLSNL
ncbi:MAG: hypothetical protein K0U59_12020 [Gammaproteobacteria bacterium]|nr:hypothetical protein [Gammaproteobacteria bacterium]